MSTLACSSRCFPQFHGLRRQGEAIFQAWPKRASGMPVKQKKSKALGCSEERKTRRENRAFKVDLPREQSFEMSPRKNILQRRGTISSDEDLKYRINLVLATVRPRRSADRAPLEKCEKVCFTHIKLAGCRNVVAQGMVWRKGD